MARRKKMDQQERLIHAYRSFSKMAPSLTQYAKSYTGNHKLKVVAGPITQTDGRIIEVRPPLALADQIDHRRQVCGLRDINGGQMCQACAIRERVMTALHHEIAHIAHGSFARYDRDEISTELYGTLSALFPDYMPAFRDKIYDQMNYGDTAHSLELAGSIHPHIAMVHMPCEDHRINTASFVREPALWRRMHDFSEDILFNGVEQDDGTKKMWQDADLDQQLIIAQLFYMEGFDIAPHFDPSVVECLQSREVTAILDKVADGDTSLHNLHQSIKLLHLFRKHGFLEKNSKALDQMSEQDKEDLEEWLKFLRELFKALFGHGDKHGSRGDDIGKQGSGQSKDPDDPSDELMSKVITSMNHLDDVPGHLDGVNVYPFGQGPCWNRRSDPVAKATEAMIGRAVAKSRVAFNVNARAKTHRDQKSGKVDARNLGKRAWNEGDSRLFKTKTVPDKRDYEVLIGFDISGSTTMGRLPVSRMQMLKYSVCALADTMNRLGVDFSIYAHNTGYPGKRNYDEDDTVGATMDIYQIKLPSERWDPATRGRLEGLGSGGSNLDGNTLRYYRKQLDRSRATDKILMYFTDGIMPGMGTEFEVPILKEEINICRQRGYTLLGVGVFTDAPVKYGLPTVQVDSEADYPLVIDHLAKRLGH